MSELLEKVIENYTKFESGLNGEKSGTFHKNRIDAFNSLKEYGFPNRKNEEYKFTNISSKLSTYVDLNRDVEKDGSLNSEYKFSTDSAIQISNVNGSWDDNINSIEESGLHIMTFESAREKHSKIFENYFNRILIKENNAFGDLNTAFVKDGLFIFVEKGKIIEKDIILHFLSSSQTLIQPRVLIVAEENSQLRVVENYKSISSQKSFTNSCTEIHVDKNSIVDHYKLQVEINEDFQASNISVNQEKGSVFTNYTFNMSGDMVRNNLDIHLNDEHIESNMFGAYMLNGKAHVDNHTTVNHAFPNCESNELYKGILEDNSTAVFNGKIFVRKDAQKTNAFQSNRNLLLSPNATVHTKPQLEIWADDVKCSHGATIG